MDKPTSSRDRLLKKALLIFAGFFAVAVVGYLTSSRGVESHATPLSVPAEALDFGTVWAQSQFEWAIPIENSSNQKVFVDSIHSSCLCSSLEPESFVIAPGHTLDVKVVLDLMPANAEDASARVRPFAISLAPVLKTGIGLARNIKWELKGSVTQVLSLRPASIYFGENLVHGLPFPRKLVRVQSRQRLQSLKASCDESIGRASVTPLDDSGQSFQIEFSLNEQMSPSTIDSHVFLTATTLDGDQQPPMPVSISGHISRPIHALPAELHFGEQELMKTFASQLRVRSAIQDHIRLVNIEHDDEINHIECHSVVDMDKELLLNISVTPATAGHHNSILGIVVSAENGSTETINVPVRWYAVEPSVVTEAGYDQITPERSPG